MKGHIMFSFDLSYINLSPFEAVLSFLYLNGNNCTWVMNQDVNVNQFVSTTERVVAFLDKIHPMLCAIDYLYCYIQT